MWPEAKDVTVPMSLYLSFLPLRTNRWCPECHLGAVSSTLSPALSLGSLWRLLVGRTEHYTSANRYS